MLDALLLARERDLAMGYTSVGAHRADWRVEYAKLPGREALSRGQEKLTALACVLAQARAYAGRSRANGRSSASMTWRRNWICAHQEQVLDIVLASKAQVILTGTEPPATLAGRAGAGAVAWFHVEHGEISRRIPGPDSGDEA